MRFSMDGFRRQLNGDVSELKTIVEAVVNDEWYDKEDLVTALNGVITHSNVINCVFDEENEDFNDISDLEIEHLEL